MWPFRRKQENLDNVPSEIKEYYQAEQRERMGVAWLLAAITLVATVAAVLGLFLGGRLIYRQLAHKNKPATTVTQPQSKTTASTTKPKSGSAKTTPSTSPPVNNHTKVTVSNPATTPSARSPQPSAASETITNTGPSSTLAVFMLTSVVSCVGYQLYVRRKLSA